MLLKTLGGELDEVLESRVKPAMKGFQSDLWRCRRYLNQYTDKVYRTHWKLLQHTYMKYCGSKIKSFSPFKGLFYEEYRQFLSDISVSINDRESMLYFLQS